MKKTHLLFCACLSASLVFPVSAQFDGFDDGDDVGWSRMDPLTEAGVPAGSYSFPDGGYRFVHAPSPAPDELGSARIGSYRPDIIQQGDFFVSVDVTNWDDAEDQNIGILAMINDPGLGTTSGYALTLDTSERRLYLSLVDAELASSAGNVDLLDEVSPETGFRLVFTRTEGELVGDLFSLADLESSLATVEGFDDFIETGSPGIFAGVDPEDGAVDVTFDNFSTSPDGPVANAKLVISGVELIDQSLVLHFSPVLANVEYVLEESADLITWAEIEDNFAEEDDGGIFEVPVRSPGFYRIMKRD